MSNKADKVESKRVATRPDHEEPPPVPKRPRKEVAAKTVLFPQAIKTEGLEGPCDQCGSDDPEHDDYGQPIFREPKGTWYGVQRYHNKDVKVPLCDHCVTDWDRSEGKLEVPSCTVCRRLKDSADSWGYSFYRYYEATLCSRCYDRRDDSDIGRDSEDEKHHRKLCRCAFADSTSDEDDEDDDEDDDAGGDY